MVVRRKYCWLAGWLAGSARNAEVLQTHKEHNPAEHALGHLGVAFADYPATVELWKFADAHSSLPWPSVAGRHLPWVPPLCSTAHKHKAARCAFLSFQSSCTPRDFANLPYHCRIAHPSSHPSVPVYHTCVPANAAWHGMGPAPSLGATAASQIPHKHLGRLLCRWKRSGCLMPLAPAVIHCAWHQCNIAPAVC